LLDKLCDGSARIPDLIGDMIASHEIVEKKNIKHSQQ
jgi:hypothetical protein